MNWYRAGVGVGALVVTVGLSACDLLRVSDPGRYEEEDLLTALEAVGNTAEGNAQRWMDWYVIWQELLGDALNFVGPAEMFRDQYALIDNGRVDFNTYPVARTPANSRYVAYNFPDGMAASRWLAHKAWEIAELAYEEGDSMEAELGLESSYLGAQIKLGWAFNNMYLGLFSCEGVLGSPDDPDGAEMYLDIQIYDSAASLFTHVIEIMGRVDPFLLELEERPDYLNAARTGRALMRMLTGDYEGAVADASAVPDGFRYDAILGGAFEDWNQMYWLGVRFRYFTLHDWVLDDTLTTFSGSLPDPWTGVPDRRRQVIHLPRPFFGDGDAVTLPTKYNSQTSGVAMVNSAQARLIEAEVTARGDNFIGAMNILDAARAEVGLPAIPVTPENEVQMLEVLLWERYAWQWLEGWRQPDLHRFGLTRPVFEALNDHDRRGIGRPTKFPGSAREAWLNPLVANDATQRCHPNA